MHWALCDYAVCAKRTTDEWQQVIVVRTFTQKHGVKTNYIKKHTFKTKLYGNC